VCNSACVDGLRALWTQKRLAARVKQQLFDAKVDFLCKQTRLHLSVSAMCPTQWDV
jgi:hypothetical protein